MPERITEASLLYAARDHERRIAHLESFELAVMANDIKNLRDDINSLKRAFYTFAFSVVGSSILFAFSVFALLGRHP